MDLPMRKRIAIAAGAFSLLLAFFVAGVFIYDASQSDRIANGVYIGSVNLSGLDTKVASQKLHAQFLKPLGEPIVARFKHASFTLTPKQAEVSADVSAMVDEAIKVSRAGTIV